jgi:hypothetical protein
MFIFMYLPLPSFPSYVVGRGGSLCVCGGREKLCKHRGLSPTATVGFRPHWSLHHDLLGVPSCPPL